MMKRIISIFMAILTLVTLAGCQKTASKTNAEAPKETKQTQQVQQDKQEAKSKDSKDSKESKDSKGGAEKSKLNAEEIVTSNFGKEDEQFDFKLKTTQKFLSNYDKICDLLDSRYGTKGVDGAAPKGFVKAGTQSQLKCAQSIEDPNKRYQYIKKVGYGLFFNDDKSKVAFEELELTLCDEDNDGKIELNDKTSAMLKIVYPKINLEEAQNKINAAVEASKNNDNKRIKLDLDDKYCAVDFNWFKYKENPLEVRIQIQQYQDYPRT